MKITKILALVLVMSMLLSISAYAAGEGPAAETPDASASDTATAEPSPTDGEDEQDGADDSAADDAGETPEEETADIIRLDKTAGKATLEGGAIGIEGYALVRTVYMEEDHGADDETAGYEVLLRDTKAVGDILHDDFDCPMDLALEGAELTGRVAGMTKGAWESSAEPTAEDGADPEDEEVPAASASDAVAAEEEETAKEEAADETAAEVTEEETEADAAEAPAEAEETAATEETPETEETAETPEEEPAAEETAAPGVHMTMDGQSVWTVTGRSELAGFTMEKGALVQAPEGLVMTVYVDCEPGTETAYDETTGSIIKELVPGVAYEGVVLTVGEEEPAPAEEEAAAPEEEAPAAPEGTPAQEAAPGPEASAAAGAAMMGDIFAALGIGTTVLDGEYGVSILELLEQLGVEVTVDPDTGEITVNDENGVLEGLIQDVLE